MRNSQGEPYGRLGWITVAILLIIILVSGYLQFHEVVGVCHPEDVNQRRAQLFDQPDNTALRQHVEALWIVLSR